MKREDKNQLTRRRIMDSALAEFALHGYGGSSVNNICVGPEISKGIIYHYFRTKDELYLACIEECFQFLTQRMKAGFQGQGSVEKQLEVYFTLRMEFFHQHPVYQPIFCEAVISPPARLTGEIQKRRQVFDALNVELLQGMLRNLPLRAGITEAEVVELFRMFQDFINARCQMPLGDESAFASRDESCRRALNVLLYGVIERKVDERI